MQLSEYFEFVAFALFDKFTEGEGDVDHLSEEHSLHFYFVVFGCEEIVEEDGGCFFLFRVELQFLNRSSMP